MELIQTILSMIVTLGVLVAFHEYGHFQVARWCGVKVVRFSIGFGKPLFRWIDKRGTEFVIAALPLGGYVKMIDEREADVASKDLPYAFNRQSVVKRIAIVAAGPAANFILAILVFWGIFMSGVTGLAPVIGEVVDNTPASRAGLQVWQEIVAVDGEKTTSWQSVSLQLMHRLGETGELIVTTKSKDSSVEQVSTLYLNEWLLGKEEPDLLRGLGVLPFRPELLPIAGDITPGGPAATAGIERGDLILTANGLEMSDWMQWVEFIQQHPDENIDVSIARNDERFSVMIRPERVTNDDGQIIGRVGMGLLPPEWPADMIRTLQYGPVDALFAGVGRTWELSIFTLGSIKKMLEGLISPKNLSGPITIAKVAGDSARSGFEAYFSFLALLSVSLGVLNLLPIPVLDGGHLLFYSIEGLKGSPVSEKFQSLAYQFGIVVVISLMVFAFYNDIVRL